MAISKSRLKLIDCRSRASLAMEVLSGVPAFDNQALFLFKYIVMYNN